MEAQLTVRIPRDLARALARRARERGVPRSTVVREALASHLGERPTPERGLAVWERVQQFAGSMPLDPAAIEADDIARRIRSHNWRE